MFDTLGQIIIRDEYFQIVWDFNKGIKDSQVDTYRYDSIKSFSILYPKWVQFKILRNIGLFLINIIASNPTFSTSANFKIEVIFKDMKVEIIELRFNSVEQTKLMEKTIREKLVSSNSPSTS